MIPEWIGKTKIKGGDVYLGPLFLFFEIIKIYNFFISPIEVVLVVFWYCLAILSR